MQGDTADTHKVRLRYGVGLEEEWMRYWDEMGGERSGGRKFEKM
jgi:hypothetical protein